MDVKSELGAWILPIGKDLSVAVGRHELKYIEHISVTQVLPGLPAYCERGFQWRDRFVPAINILSLIERRRIPVALGEQVAVIVAYESAQEGIQYGAIFLQGVPQLITLQPQQSVAISELQKVWQVFVHAAFQYQDIVYPVLDLPCLFDKTPSELLSLH